MDASDGLRVAKAAHPPVMVEVGDIESEVLSRALERVKNHYKHGDREITLRINSNGGSVFEGFSFIQSMEELKKGGMSVTCVVDVRAISMAFVILQSDVCDKRLATPRSLFLAHNGSLHTEGGTVEDMDEDIELLKVINDSLSLLCANRIGMPILEYRKKLKDHKSWTFGTEEALKHNVIDGVIEALATPKLDDN